MQKLFDELKGHLEAFLQQRDDEAVMVSKLLEGMDDASASQLFWFGTDEFVDAATWVSGLADTFAVKHAAVTMKLREQGRPPWPALPDAILDPAQPPVERLREMMSFSRALAPLPETLSVWCLFPLLVHDWQAWARLLWDLLQHTFPSPWFHHLRIYVRADPADEWVKSVATKMPRVGWYDPDLSQAAMQRAFDEEAMDRSRPMEQRMQSVFLSAQMDFAHNRLAEALQKHATLLKYFTATRNGTMTALVLNSVGECHQRLGNLDHAGYCFEQALVPAASTSSPPVPVLLNLSLNLGNVRMQQARFAEAETYYDVAQGFAAMQRAADTRLRAIENLGVCQDAQGKYPDAAATWHTGARAAGELEMLDLRRSMLERLRDLHARTGDDAGRARVEYELAGLSTASARR